MPAPPPDPRPTTSPSPPFRPRQPHQRRAPLLRHPDQRPRATPHLRQSHQPRPDLPAHRFPPVIASSTPAPMPRTPPTSPPAAPMPRHPPPYPRPSSLSPTAAASAPATARSDMPAPPPDPRPTTSPSPPFRPRQPHQRRAPLLRHPDQRPRATPHLRQSHQPRPDLPAHRFPPVIASSTPAPMPRTPPPRADGLRIRAATPRSAPPCPVLPEHDLPAPRLRGSPSPARPAVLSAPRAATPAPAPKAWGPGSKLRRPRPVSARRPPFSVPKYPGGRRHRRRGAAPPCLPRQEGPAP